jgi:hypothetical protein
MGTAQLFAPKHRLPCQSGGLRELYREHNNTKWTKTHALKGGPTCIVSYPGNCALSKGSVRFNTSGPACCPSSPTWGCESDCESVERLSGLARGKELAHALVLGRIRVCIHACVRACVLCFVGSYVPKVVWRDVFDRYPHFTAVARQKRCGGEQEICSRVSSDVRSVCTAESCLVHVHVRA